MLPEKKPANTILPENSTPEKYIRRFALKPVESQGEEPVRAVEIGEKIFRMSNFFFFVTRY